MFKELKIIIFNIISFTFVTLIFLESTNIVFAQSIVINEFNSAASNTSDTDWPDWVEVYKGGEEITLFELKDAAGNTKALSEAICNGEFCTVDWSNKLNNTGDTIMLVSLANPDIVIDSITYGGESNVCPPGHGQSVGRVVLTEGADPGNLIERFAISSKGQTNYGSELSLCPSPTPVPTSTPTPTAKPTITPSPTSSPTPIPTSTPTLKPTATPKPTTKQNSIPEIVEAETVIANDTSNTEQLRNEILGVSINNSDPSDTVNKKFPILAFILVLFGTGLLGFAGFIFYKQKKSGQFRGN